MTLTVLTDSTINFDQVSFLSEPAIAYGKAGLTVTVNANILVDATVDNAIFSDQSGSIVIHHKLDCAPISIYTSGSVKLPRQPDLR